MRKPDQYYHNLSNPHAPRAGVATVEFALVVPVLLTILLGIIEFGLLFEDFMMLKKQMMETTF